MSGNGERGKEASILGHVPWSCIANGCIAIKAMLRASRLLMGRYDRHNCALYRVNVYMMHVVDQLCAPAGRAGWSKIHFAGESVKHRLWCAAAHQVS